MSDVAASATAGFKAAAEVVKAKNSHKFSPRLVEDWHPYKEQGLPYAAVDVATGTFVKGFADEESCNKFCEEMNSK